MFMCFRLIRYLPAMLDLTRASDLFPNADAEAQVKAAKEWLGSKGVRDFEPVSLFSDQLEKVGILGGSLL